MEVESNSRPVGGLPEPHAQEGEIRAQNARRIARRRQASALAAQVAQTSGEDLSRFGERRKVGGRFEKLQAVPARRTPARQGLDFQDLARFLEAFQSAPRKQVLGQTSYLSSFAPYILGRE